MSVRRCDERIDVAHDGASLPVEVWWAPRRPAPAVLVISELFGLNDDIRRIAVRLADHGYTAATPDLWRGKHWARCAWRTLAGLQLGGGGRAANELDAALRHLDAHPDVRGTGAIGFCMGGGFALLLGTRGTARVAGGFYGVTPAFEAMQRHMCPVVGGYGAKDTAFAREGRKLDAALDRLAVPRDLKVYEGVGHSYMNQHEPSLSTSVGRALLAVGYDERAAEDSWSRMLAFFAEHLGQPATSP